MVVDPTGTAAEEWLAKVESVPVRGWPAGKHLAFAVRAEPRCRRSHEAEFLSLLAAQPVDPSEALQRAAAEMADRRGGHWEDVLCQGTDAADIAAGEILAHVDTLFDVVQVHVVRNPSRGLPANDPRARAIVLDTIERGSFRPWTGTTLGRPECAFSTTAASAQGLSPDRLRDELGLLKPGPQHGSGKEVLVVFEFQAANARDLRIPTVIDARCWAFAPAPAGSTTGTACNPRTGAAGLPEVVHRGVPSAGAAGVRRVPGTIQKEWWEV